MGDARRHRLQVMSRLGLSTPPPRMTGTSPRCAQGEGEWGVTSPPALRAGRGNGT